MSKIRPEHTQGSSKKKKKTVFTKNIDFIPHCHPKSHFYQDRRWLNTKTESNLDKRNPENLEKKFALVKKTENFEHHWSSSWKYFGPDLLRSGGSRTTYHPDSPLASKPVPPFATRTILDVRWCNARNEHESIRPSSRTLDAKNGRKLSNHRSVLNQFSIIFFIQAGLAIPAQTDYYLNWFLPRNQPTLLLRHFQRSELVYKDVKLISVDHSLFPC